MNQKFKIVVADRDEQWLNAARQSLENQQMVRLDVGVELFHIKEGGKVFTSAQAAAMFSGQCGIFRPLYRVALHQRPTLLDIHSYRLDAYICTKSLASIVWVATSEDRTHPRWPRFREWAKLHRQCIIEEDADWSEFGGVWNVALLASLYLFFRKETQSYRQITWPLMNVRFDNFDEKRPFRKPFTWPLEQSLLIKRLKMTLRKDEMLLRHDCYARRLATLI